MLGGLGGGGRLIKLPQTFSSIHLQLCSPLTSLVSACDLPCVENTECPTLTPKGPLHIFSDSIVMGCLAWTTAGIKFGGTRVRLHLLTVGKCSTWGLWDLDWTKLGSTDVGCLWGEEGKEDDNGEDGVRFPPPATWPQHHHKRLILNLKEELCHQLKELEEIQLHTCCFRAQEIELETGPLSFLTLPQLCHAYKAAWAA